MIGIVCSMKDEAGRNLYSKLKEEFGGANREGYYFLIKTEVDGPFVNELPEAEVYVFASKHQSKSGRPSLCVHAPGNWSQAAFGGNRRELSWTRARLMKAYLKRLSAEKKTRGLGRYEVTMECTHHGPSHFKTPCVFIEVGSTPKEWNDMQAVSAVVSSIISGREKKEWIPSVGFGGGHYPTKLTRVQLETDYALGHICPKYENMDLEMIKQAVKKCNAKKFIIDWKGTNKEQHEIITSASQELEIELLRAGDLL